jgi:putative acetyltransferase
LKVFELRAAAPADRDAMFDVWLRATRATHAFVAAADMEAFVPLVREYLGGASEFWVLTTNGAVAGFMGLAGSHMESLFVAPEFHGRGGGRLLVRHARALHGELTVDVNEQNTPAARFYESCGFIVEGRSELDGTGRPYPLLHMRLADGAQLEGHK